MLEVDEERGRALLLSRYVLDWKPFDARVGEEEPEYYSWDDGTLRSWLNGKFVDAAFEDEDLELLEGDLPFAPEDKVHLLSAEDIRRYFPDDYDTGYDDMFYHSCESVEATNYVRARRSWRSFDHDYPEWWTNSATYYGRCIQTVGYCAVGVTFMSPDVEKGVRPAV